MRAILISQREEDQIARGGLSWADRRWARITGVLLGYGYQPWRALLYLAAVFAVFVTLAVVFGGYGGLAVLRTAPLIVRRTGHTLDATLTAALLSAESQSGLRLFCVGASGSSSRSSVPGSQDGGETGQQCTQRLDVLLAELLGPLALHLADSGADRAHRGMSARREMHAFGALVVRVVTTLQVAERLELAEVVVHGLLGHAGLRGDLAGPAAVGAGVTQDHQVGRNQVVETLTVQRVEHAGADDVDGHAQQRAEERAAE